MAASSSRSYKYDVFPSFRGEDVRDNFRSHLLKAFDDKGINTFKDNELPRSRPIGPELTSAIREAKISIVIFSKIYASSTWCLNELVEIYQCYMKQDQMVFPIFYNVDPSEVKKQTGEFGKVFDTTCKDKPENQTQEWKQVLADVAVMAGEHIKEGVDEAQMVVKITNDVWNKLFGPSDYFDDFVGLEAHIEAMNSHLSLESVEVRMVGIWGPSGVGKSTIGRALFTHLSPQFPSRVFQTYKKTSHGADFEIKLSWEQQLLSKILGKKDIEISESGEVRKRLQHKKVLIILDDVVELELLKTLVGKTEWFGPGSRIIVITQDRHLLEAHNINLIYEVALPSEDLALEMLCQSAFEKKYPPDDFRKLAVDVANLAGKLPLALSVLGSSLKNRGKKDWEDMLPRLENVLEEGDIGKKLKVCYERLNKRDQLLFLYVACHFSVYDFDGACIERVFGYSSEISIGLKILAEKSLIRTYIGNGAHVEMHDLLVKLGREIFYAESSDPGKRRFLVDVNDIRDVLTHNTGTETVRGIILNQFDVKESISIHEKSFDRMCNLEIIYLYRRFIYRHYESTLDLPQDLVSLPSNLRMLVWDYYPAKWLPSTFKAELLVKLRMKNSNLEKLWDGTLELGNLKVMALKGSRKLKEIPDLSKAINLKKLNLYLCESLEILSPSIHNLTKLEFLDMRGCTNLKSIPSLRNLENLRDNFSIEGCSMLRNFPPMSAVTVKGMEDLLEINVENCLWGENLPGPVFLDCLLSCIPNNICQDIVRLKVHDCSILEKLWEGVQSLENLWWMELSKCENLTEFPDLSRTTNLDELILNDCKSLVMVPSTIGNLQSLKKLVMKNCTMLEVLPMDVNLSSLEHVDFSGCSRLTEFPHISTNLAEMDLSECVNLTEFPDISKATSLKWLVLNDCKSLVMVPSTIGNLQSLKKLVMKNCTMLEVLPMDVNLSSLEHVDFSGCSRLTEFPHISTNLAEMDLSECVNLTEFPDISKATSLKWLVLNDCKSLVMVPSTIGNLQSLKKLVMKNCTMLEVLPMDVNLSSLEHVDFSGCSRLTEFPHISTNLAEMDLSECVNLTEFPDISKATSLKWLVLNDCKSLVMVPSTIGNLQSLKKLVMKNCTMLEVLPMDVNLSSLEHVDFSGCSRLSMFPQISTSIEKLYLNDTAIEGVPCFIKNFSRLEYLNMCRCKRLKNISPNIFRLTSLKIANFSDCGGVITTLSDGSGENYNVRKMSTSLSYDAYESTSGCLYFKNCFKLDEDARELILRSCLNLTVLPGGDVPAYFKHRASGDFLTVTLPPSVLFQDFIRFKACVLLEYPLKYLDVFLVFNGKFYTYRVLYNETHAVWKRDYLVLFSFKFRPTSFPSNSDFIKTKFTFIGQIIDIYSYERQKIKACGARLLNVSLSPDGSTKTEYNRQSGEKRDVIESLDTERSKKRMLMTSGTSVQYFNLICGQNVANTGLTALNLELSLGQGEASSVSSYPSLEREDLCVDHMITEQQDTQIPIMDPLPSTEWNPFTSTTPKTD